MLLVSGEPHAGERTWRNLLKSDASVDLVHFTILRPPEKQDGTPINELTRFRMLWSTVVMMRLPPGVPTTSTGRPSRATMVGLIELKGRLPGAIALASPWTSPYMLGSPAFALKSSISLLSRTPVPAAMTLAPNQSLRV